MKIKNKNVLIYGMSVSGEWAMCLAKKHKAIVFVYDDNEDVLNKNYPNAFVVRELTESIIKELDLIVVSPSIENEKLDAFIKQNKQIMSELEFASNFTKNIIAITGTNGKTTTTSITQKILSKKKKTVACGNIGYPLSRAVLEHKRAIKVTEVSSFMLEHSTTFCPTVATLLNIHDDHLIRHKTMHEYSEIKLSIFKNLTKKDYAVVNLDEKICPTQQTNIITYSYNHKSNVRVKNGYIEKEGKRIVALNELKLKGKHNIYNIMCAICIASIFKVSDEKIREALLEISNEKYRIELVGRINNINFINDSKSTNINSTLASTETVKGVIILLLGGSNKGLDYTKLFNNLTKRVKEIVVFGEIANELEKANKNKFKLTTCKDLSSSFDYAVSISKHNDTILLSPASASYDQFSNYIERGELFNKKVSEYASRQTE